MPDANGQATARWVPPKTWASARSVYGTWSRHCSPRSAKARLPGAVALIARHGQVLLHQNVGQQDPAQGVPMELDSIFRIYSMTKPVVSVAVMQLMERGQLLLSDPVAKYLPEFADMYRSAPLVDSQSVLQRPQGRAHRARPAAPHRWLDLRDTGQ